MNSWAFTADGQLCVCDGTCGWGKLLHNYTPLSIWPIILLKCERADAARALLSTMAENFKQKEKGFKSSAHQSVCDLKDTHTHHHKALIFEESLWGFSGLDSTFTNRETGHIHNNVDTFVFFSLCWAFINTKWIFFHHRNKAFGNSSTESVHLNTTVWHRKAKTFFFLRFLKTLLYCMTSFKPFKIIFSRCGATGTNEKLK